MELMECARTKEKGIGRERERKRRRERERKGGVIKKERKR